MPVAVIDIGTNTTRLLVAERDDDGGVVELERRTTITSLGQGVDATGRLAAEAMERVARAIAEYRELIDRLGAERIVAVATSAMRDAENGPAFRDELKERFGVDARTISGDEEARLTFLGATAGRDDDRETVVIDIGGGIDGVRGRAPGPGPRLPHLDADGVRAAHGAVSEERSAHQGRDGVAGRGCEEDGASRRGTTWDRRRRHRHLARRHRRRGAGARLHARPRRAASASPRCSPPCRSTERRQVDGLHPDRAPTIVAGAVILTESVRTLGLGEVEVSDRDILHGAAAL